MVISFFRKVREELSCGYKAVERVDVDLAFDALPSASRARDNGRGLVEVVVWTGRPGHEEHSKGGIHVISPGPITPLVFHERFATISKPIAPVKFFDASEVAHLLQAVERVPVQRVRGEILVHVFRHPGKGGIKHSFCFFCKAAALLAESLKTVHDYEQIRGSRCRHAGGRDASSFIRPAARGHVYDGWLALTRSRDWREA